MNSWRDEVLKHFDSSFTKVYIANDSDGLLRDVKVIENLEKNLFEIADFDDPIAFRYMFETKYRELISKGTLKLIIRNDEYGLIPYDLYKDTIKVSLKLGEIFPKLSYPILKGLDSDELDALYAVYGQYQGSSSNKDTIEFLLKKVYKIHQESIDTKNDFIKFMLSFHYRNQQLPYDVSNYLVEQLHSRKDIRQLPVKELIESKSSFYTFLEKEWSIYVNGLYKEKQVIKESETDSSYYHTEHSFSDPDIRRLLNDLFIEKELQPIEGLDKNNLPTWVHPGIINKENAAEIELFKSLLGKIRLRAVNVESYKDWVNISKLIGELSYLSHKIESSTDAELFDDYQKSLSNLNTNFESWMLEGYASIYNSPILPNPTMVHQIPNYLELMNQDKVALLVLDGMSFVQWSQIRQALNQYDIRTEVNGVFAWVPTLTSISRQAIFSGKMPMMYADSIYTTNKEELLWKTFWENNGVLKQNVSYQRALGNEEYRKDNIEALRKHNIQVSGLVIDTIDKLMHGAIQGQLGIYAELDIWLKSGYLQNLIKDLQDTGYTIYITSDHGNTECTGVGRINDGVLAHSKGERVRIYNNEDLCKERANEYSVITWPNIGLPKDFNVLLADQNKAFISKGKKAVSHGGISLQEVVVPFVKVKN
ncbi:hypothetical protein HNQ94_000040 [Salirhabdus euzebyi]|uniref:PglZ domain-containing protein n=1 Tax=Salirhabdus euzebyi TaxID=394506 RepID=A0A841PS42_9BACI|nr:BREX-3 system phosphatase PglZ [Salirhabdus euzebyi]MBB6451619.1 hypothetical protein [Salirhabdus euzebyi]